MGAQSRPVGRPSKNTLRIELRLNADDAAIKALIAEAAGRGVTMQRHIEDILIARFLGGSPQQQIPEQQAAKDSASALADEWM